MPDQLTILTPVVQYIFAAFSLILLAIIFFIIKALLNDRRNHFKTLGNKVDALARNVADLNVKVDSHTRLLNELTTDTKPTE